MQRPRLSRLLDYCNIFLYKLQIKLAFFYQCRLTPTARSKQASEHESTT